MTWCLSHSWTSEQTHNTSFTTIQTCVVTSFRGRTNEYGSILPNAIITPIPTPTGQPTPTITTYIMIRAVMGSWGRRLRWHNCLSSPSLAHEYLRNLPRTRAFLSRWKSARKGRWEGGNGLDLSSLSFSWSPALRHQSLALRFRHCAKNEAPEEEVDAKH